MAEQIGVLPAAFALLGLGVSLTVMPGRMAFAYPLVYLFFMSGTRVSFHRNFLILYPFAGVAFGCGVAAAADLLRMVRPGSVLLRRARAALFVVAAAVCVAGSARSLPVSWRMATTHETRSLAIDKVNELAAGAGSAPLVGIAQELGIHRIDLARLKVRSEVAPLFDLVCAERTRYDLLVTANEMHGDEPPDQAAADLMNSLARAWAPSAMKVGGPRLLHLTNVNQDPGILILSRATDRAGSLRCTGSLDLRWRDPDDEETMRTGPKVDLDRVASAGTDWLAVAPGPHAFTWFANGPSKRGFMPQLRCTLKMRIGGIVAEREWRTFDLPGMEMPYALTFEAPEGAEFSVAFERSEGGEISVWSVRSLQLPREASAGVGAQPPAGVTTPPDGP
jgi:hypothetical protein